METLGTACGSYVVVRKRHIEFTSHTPTLLRTAHFPGHSFGKPMIVGWGRDVVVDSNVGRISGGVEVVCRYFWGGKGGKVGVIPF